MKQTKQEYPVDEFTEITSPRTAEHPDPVDHDHCCGAVHPTRAVAASGWEKWKAYIPTAISLTLLVLGIVFDYVSIDWFSGYLRVVWYTVAYFLVGWEVLWHALSISEGERYSMSFF